MLQLEHKWRIVQACFPTSDQDALEIWHDIKPVKFGTSQKYSTALTLAAYQVPEDAAYLLILRVENYVTSFSTLSQAYGRFMPPPQGTAQWVYTDVVLTTPQYQISPIQSINIYADTDEFLFAKGDHRIALLANLTGQGDDGTTVVRTLVYGYLIGALIADRLGASESTYFTKGPTDSGGQFAAQTPPSQFLPGP